MSEDERRLIGISKIARQKVIDRLKHAYAKDYLEEADFENRLDLATNTQDRSILLDLVDDLPETSGPETRGEASSESLPAARSSPAAPADTALTKPHSTLVSFFSGVTRKGEWNPARRIKCVSVLGGIDLDFTNAAIPSGGIDLDVFCVLGGVTLVVPEGINVDAHPLAIMAGVDNRLPAAGKSDKSIRIHGFVFMGGIDIKPPRKKYFRNLLKKMFTDE